MITRKFKTHFNIRRQSWYKEDVNGVQVDRSEEEVVGTFMGYRQQASPEYAQSMELAFSKAYSVWCPVGTGVFEGDVLESKYGVDIVKAKQTYRDGRNPHIQLGVEFIGQEATS